MNNYIEINCLEAIQPIGKMYVGIIDSKDLSHISYADVRRLEEGKDNREVEEYIGLQRPLSQTREKEIGKYVNLIDATFPNSIILSISSENAEYDETTHKLKIKYSEDVAKVLDGQHRIAGLKHFEGDVFQCIVTIYIDMDIEDQAIIFATINKEQKGVNKSLVADLFDFAKTRSPQKTCHNIARALSSKEGSPFYEKIKILGTARNSEKETITQDTFVKSLIKYISKDPQADRDIYKKAAKSFLAKKSPDYFSSEKEKESLVLRRIFIDDASDVTIAQIMWNYFAAIQTKWPIAWGEVRNNNVFNKSTGYIALMKLFGDIYKDINKEIPEKNDFYHYFSRCTIEDLSFTKEIYLPGVTGQNKLYKDLKEQIFDQARKA